MLSLTGRTVIVTGAGKGLGKAYALDLAAHGANVLVNNRRHPGEADTDTSAMATVNLILERGGRAEANYADVTDPDSGESMIAQALDRFGRVDAVIANAGVDKASRFEQLTSADFQRVFDTSFFGNLYLVQAAWKHWINFGPGRAVLTTSGAGLYGNHGQAAYSAAKAAIIGLTKALAIEGASRGIKINAVAPYAFTAMTESYLNPTDTTLLSPNSVAPLVRYLVSPECEISGEILVSAGGKLRSAYISEGVVHSFEEDLASVTHDATLHSRAGYSSATESFLGLKAQLSQPHSDDHEANH